MSSIKQHCRIKWLTRWLKINIPWHLWKHINRKHVSFYVLMWHVGNRISPEVSWHRPLDHHQVVGCSKASSQAILNSLGPRQEREHVFWPRYKHRAGHAFVFLYCLKISRKKQKDFLVQTISHIHFNSSDSSFTVWSLVIISCECKSSIWFARWGLTPPNSLLDFFSKLSSHCE